MTDRTRKQALEEKAALDIERHKKEMEKRREEYAADERFRQAMEKDINKTPSNLKYSRALYRMGKGKMAGQETLLFPVKIIDCRKMFGKIQCEITPLSQTETSLLGSPLGHRWIDRKFLILSHDHEYKSYQQHIEKEEAPE